MKNSLETNGITIPKIKEFSVAELKKVTVPNFQRWIVKSNKKELRESIEEAGQVLRCPVITHLKSTGENLIIDGNHLREIIIETNSPKTMVSCIYHEVGDYSDAATLFRLLNTKGKKLDLVDITNLHMHTSGAGSVYDIIWNVFLGNPSKSDEVTKIDGFSTPTIVEFLCSNKNKYRNGEATKEKFFIPRKALLTYLVNAAPQSWKQDFKPYGYKHPTGASILGFANFWFSNNLHNKFSESDFLKFINNIFLNKKEELLTTGLIINRDNAGKLLRIYLEENNIWKQK